MKNRIQIYQGKMRKRRKINRTQRYEGKMKKNKKETQNT